MKLQVSEKTSSYEKPAHIRKGYYPARLIEVKERTTKDGKLLEAQLKSGRLGHQLIFLFAIHHLADSPNNQYGSVGKPVVISEGNSQRDLVLPAMFYSEYKQDDGTYSTAITPKSRITQALTALGWKFSALEGVDTDKLIGNWVEVNIDDIIVDWKNEAGSVEKITRSVIQKIQPFQGDVSEEYKQKSGGSGQVVERTLKHEEIVAREENIEEGNWEDELPAEAKASIESLRSMHRQKVLTTEGLELAIANVKKANGVKK